jgi:magnesium transporter
MLTIYRDENGTVRTSHEEALPKNVIWIDLLDPTSEERAFVEHRAKLRLPSEDELSRIEASSRIRVERGVLYLSAPVLAAGNTPDAHLSPAGFIIWRDMLVTLRYTDLASFDHVAKLIHADETIASSIGVFAALMEAMVDRGADLLEILGGEIDTISKQVFRGDQSDPKHMVRSTQRLRALLTRIGSIGDRVSQCRDVLLGIGRVASYTSDLGQTWIEREFAVRLGAVVKDVGSLAEYEMHLAGKVQLLLDAVLGYITIEQNDLFKILTIASVVGIPPTLLAGIWGMNFKFMPELNWSGGYMLAWVAIILSAIVPLVWFKVRGWF